MVGTDLPSATAEVTSSAVEEPSSKSADTVELLKRSGDARALVIHLQSASDLPHLVQLNRALLSPYVEMQMIKNGLEIPIRAIWDFWKSIFF